MWPIFSIVDSLSLRLTLLFYSSLKLTHGKWQYVHTCIITLDIYYSCKVQTHVREQMDYSCTKCMKITCVNISVPMFQGRWNRIQRRTKRRKESREYWCGPPTHTWRWTLMEEIWPEIHQTRQKKQVNNTFAIFYQKKETHLPMLCEAF